MNAIDIIGAVMQTGVSPEAGHRIGSILGKITGGDAPTASQDGTMGAGLFDMLSKAAGAMLGGGSGGVSADVLKQVAGAVLGGGAPAGNTGAGTGTLALFGALAAQALQMAQGMFGGAADAAAGLPGARMDEQTAVLAGMRPPVTLQEQQQVNDVAMLTLRAMISAMKADGRIDDQERSRLLGKLNEGGISTAEQRLVDAEMQRPIDLDDLVQGVDNPQVAAQIYTASLMAITVDTEPERHYLADLAAKLRLDPQVVGYLHQAVGLS